MQNWTKTQRCCSSSTICATLPVCTFVMHNRYQTIAQDEWTASLCIRKRPVIPVYNLIPKTLIEKLKSRLSQLLVSYWRRDPSVEVLSMLSPKRLEWLLRRLAMREQQLLWSSFLHLLVIRDGAGTNRRTHRRFGRDPLGHSGLSSLKRRRASFQRFGGDWTVLILENTRLEGYKQLSNGGEGWRA